MPTPASNGGLGVALAVELGMPDGLKAATTVVRELSTRRDLWRLLGARQEVYDPDDDHVRSAAMSVGSSDGAL